MSESLADKFLMSVLPSPAYIATDTLFVWSTDGISSLIYNLPDFGG
jgi:hypothetical protein